MTRPPESAPHPHSEAAPHSGAAPTTPSGDRSAAPSRPKFGNEQRFENKQRAKDKQKAKKKKIKDKRRDKARDSSAGLPAPEPPPQPAAVSIRPVQTEDLDIFFRLFSDPASITMAAFTAEDPTDRAAFDAHWQSLLASEQVTARTVIWDQSVAGNVASFEVDGDTEVTYWIDQQFWGHGIATAALRQLLDYVTTRPVYARAASDNEASLRVLGKCGFRPIGSDRGYANARGAEIDETILRLDD